MSPGHIGPTVNGIKPQIMRKDAHIISQAYYTYWVKRNYAANALTFSKICMASGQCWKAFFGGNLQNLDSP